MSSPADLAPVGASPGPDTPMFRQYREMKAAHPDALLFYRMGDFYELFGEDAVWTAAALELTLTSRNRNAPDEIPMCGVPHHAVDGYLRRLLDMGRKVAIADQVEDPRTAKGLVKREVTRVLTPGLAVDGVDAHEPAWLVAVVGGAGGWGLASLDVSTGDLRTTEPPDLDAVLSELTRLEPRELLVGRDADDPEVRGAARAACVTVVDDPDEAATERELARFPRGSTLGLGAGGVAAAALLAYADANLAGRLGNVRPPAAYVLGRALELDEATRRNLELFRPLRGTGRSGTLVGLLDQARTAMGGRLLREWIGAPLLDPVAIGERHDAVATLVGAPDRRRDLRDALGKVADVERISGRVAQGSATPRDLGALRDSLLAIPALRAALAGIAAGLPAGGTAGLPAGGTAGVPAGSTAGALAATLPADACDDVAGDLAAWLVDDPPVASGEGGVIRAGADRDVDRLRALSRDAKGAIAGMEGELRETTGIASLKIRSNGVFGYYIEVTKANLEKVPGTWHRKQTIANGERYITPELKEYEEQVSGAEERLLALEQARFVALRERVGGALERLASVARGLAALDVYGTFAELAVKHRWVRPVVDAGPDLRIAAGRHPVVEAARREERFVPNDLALEPKGRLVILTGPNMAGKSTLMRQIALTVLLAQAGSFVPAAEAHVGVCDRICVRVGASDDLAHGQSTFMVEMAETANILGAATGRSLVLLDEIGRGTSTYDGLAIAWAVAEDLHDRVRCRAVFATHYHELAALAESCAAVRNLHVSATEHGDRLVFLRTVKEGPAPGSYGIQCARLAGLPPPVVGRAKELLASLERRRPRPEATQLSLFGAPAEEPEPRRGRRVERAPAPEPLVDPVRKAMLEVDPDALTPRQAHELLYQLRRLAGD